MEEEKDALFYNLEGVKQLQAHWKQSKTDPKLHLRKLLEDEARNEKMNVKFDHLIMDYSHQNITPQTMELLAKVVKETKLFEKIDKMFKGEIINISEQRAVMHMALRASKDNEYKVAGANVTPEVHKVLDRVKDFSDKVRKGEFTGYSGKKLTTFIVIGIGGSYLGPEFVCESLKTEPTCRARTEGLDLRFIANVDPVDFLKGTTDVDFESTFFIINSKTFTTSETMLNARTCKTWLCEKYAPKVAKAIDTEIEKEIVGRHMCAVSTNKELTEKFGIKTPDNVFEFWDWVGGRYSVWAAIGVLPLSLYFGFDVMEEFLRGGESIDNHFLQEKNVADNIPLLLGLIGFYNTHSQGYATRAVCPYSQALFKFAPHIQQLNMESTGKGITNDGIMLPHPDTCPIIFGEPGTNGQHSFFQLIHQGRVVPVEFIGFMESHYEYSHLDEKVDNHDELMANFFAQPDALANGKSMEEVTEDPKIKPGQRPYKVFEGNRPSLSFLFEKLTAYTCGQLLAIYEHRVAVESFLFGVNAFDQMGVELGKLLATDVRNIFADNKANKPLNLDVLPNSATRKLLKTYIDARNLLKSKK